MSPYLVLSVVASYFALLLVISWFTGRDSGNFAFYLGNKRSPWPVVAFGMIGASVSGVTFVSVPGWVGDSQFSYMQMVAGYLLGYFVVANILMPLYYRLNLTSIYTYLHKRFGFWSYKTGASFFLLSRLVGTSCRLFLVANVLQITAFDAWGVPFAATVIITIMLIWLYTFRGGIKTIIWTDTLQTACMLGAAGFSIWAIGSELQMGFGDMVGTIAESDYSRVFFFDDWNHPHHFVKQFLSGAFITIAMTGLDQDMMQKNLSCKNIKDAKKNMYGLSLMLIPVNLMFLALGVLLYVFALQTGINLPERSDDLFPLIATGGYLMPAIMVMFVVGLVAAACSSGDSTLTALTTSFTVDILRPRNKSEKQLKIIRQRVHLFMSVAVVVFIMLFRAFSNEAVISAIFTLAGYTYGPLLGLFAFGLFTRYGVKDRFVPYIAILSPVISFFVDRYSAFLFNGYEFGYELLIVNGFITFAALWLLRLAGGSKV